VKEEVVMEEENGAFVTDKRRFERYGYVGVVRVADETQIEEYALAKMLNISSGGMYIETDARIDEGRKVKVWLEESVPEINQKEFSGRTRWRKTLDDPYSAVYGYGIQFV
jgi:hypothetical protein